MIGEIIKTFCEFSAVVLLIIGFANEKKIVKWEAEHLRPYLRAIKRLIIRFVRMVIRMINRFIKRVCKSF